MFCQLGIRPTPNRNRRLQASGSGLREPHRAASQVGLDQSDFDQALLFERPQIASKRRWPTIS